MTRQKHTQDPDILTLRAAVQPCLNESNVSYLNIVGIVIGLSHLDFILDSIDMAIEYTLGFY